MEEKDSEIQQPLIVKETSDLEEGIPGLYSTAGFANPEKNFQNQKNKNQNQQTKKLKDNDFSDQQQQLNGQNQYKNINYSNIDLTKQRLVYLDGTVYPQRNNEDINLVKNYKYSANLFVPKVLYNYFKHFQNLLILIIVFIQFIPDFLISYYWATFTPFALTLGLLFYKEQQDDKHRRQINKNINQQPYKILTAASEEIVACKDIKVGDLLLLGPNQRVPCDIILLHTPSEENGQLFVNTEQIDGKSDIQIRRSVKFTHNYAKSNSLYTLKACVEIGPPNKLINSFHGKFKNESSGQEQIVENLSVYNTVWANSYLTSGRAIGLVIYTGNNTKSQMNWEKFHYKIPKVDQEMNKLTYIYFIFILALSTSVSVLEGFDSSWNYEFVRNLIMYLAVLPISIRFCLTISKILLVNRIEKDTSFKNIKVNNRNNPEDLGRFEFMLCDKTGTITSTQMTFKKIRLFDLEYDYTQIEEMKQIIAQKSKFLGICADLNEKTKVKFRDTDHELRDTFTCITICNNVVPIGQGEDVTYQTSSQDEISLVKLSESLGIRLLKKNKDVVQIENAQKEKETYQIVQEFPFTSEQRKMGILFCCRENGKYIYLTKGAEDAMVKVLPERQMPFIMEQNEILTSQGLRTMIYGYRYIPEKEFKKWYLTYGEALKNNPFSDSLKRTAQEDIEKGVQFLSISGVEEQVNEKVKETFESIRGSGIRVWMVTGDNINTTKRIAILSGFKPEGYDFITFKQITDEYQMSLELTQLDKALSISRKKIVVLDSVSYKTAIRFKESYFFDLLKVCHSVICCNFTPAQKASLTLSVKRHIKNANYVVSVGNGINDIQMFQKSDYSICISDEPNNNQLKQATIASDLRISKFKDIDKLLQYYGLNGYKRSTVMLSYLVQRGTILTTIQAVFTMLFDVTIQIFSPMVTMFLATIFCICPIMMIVNHFDYDMAVTKKHREIYTYLQKNRELSKKNFLIWAFRAIYQGVMSTVLAFYMFQDHFDLQNQSFFIFVIIELLNVWSEINFSFFAIMFSVFQIMLYVLVLYADSGQILTFFHAIQDTEYMKKIGIIILVIYVPLSVMKWILNYKYPSVYQKMLKDMKNDSKKQIKDDSDDNKVHQELQEYNLKMELEFTEKQRKIDPTYINPDLRLSLQPFKPNELEGELIQEKDNKTTSKKAQPIQKLDIRDVQSSKK